MPNQPPPNMPHAKNAEILRQPPRPLPVVLERGAVPLTNEVALWGVVRNASERISFSSYAAFIDSLCGNKEKVAELRRRLNLPFLRVDAYELLKDATDQFLRLSCGLAHAPDWKVIAETATAQLGREVSERDLKHAWDEYTGADGTIPYLDMLARKYPARATDRASGTDDVSQLCSFVLEDRIRRPCLVELIWSYWMEEAMLVQVLNAVSLRFQNRRGPGDRAVLAQLEIDPLRPLNNLLWGYVQDEQHRLSVVRRAHEYDHHYGLRLVGKAVGNLRPVDSRSEFLASFHRLLQLTAQFYQRDDDTTVRADAFPVLNALKEVNLVLGGGGSNQYGDLPSVARAEMLMQQWILARPEMREFFSSRPSVLYPEPWMERLESAKLLLGLNTPSVLHMYNLATMGERLLLSIRFHPWTGISDTAEAANWARSFRSDVQGYVHAYHAVTNVDLTAAAVSDRIDCRQPSLIMRERMDCICRR